jgi:O-methyltransferase
MIDFNYGSVRSLNHLVGRALSTYQGIQHTYILAKHALGVKGAFVECGVAYGGSAAAMLTAMVDAGDLRDLHLFDSFQGIPLAGPKDTDQPGFGGGNFIADRNLPIEERLKSSGISSCSVEHVRSHFEGWKLPLEKVHFHEGWFQHTLPKNEVGPIAMLRLDGDLYESVECCLKWLYPKVVSGGVVLSDDWILSGERDAIRDYFNGDLPDVKVTVDTGACYWIKS